MVDHTQRFNIYYLSLTWFDTLQGVDGGHSERSAQQSQGRSHGKQSCPRDPLSPGLAALAEVSDGTWNSGAVWKEQNETPSYTLL